MEQALYLFLGAALSMLGGIIQTRISSKHARDIETRKLRSERLERLGSLVLAADEWVQECVGASNVDIIESFGSGPKDQMLLLVSLYFPSIEGKTSDLVGVLNKIGILRTRTALDQLHAKLSGPGDPAVETLKIGAKYSTESKELVQEFLSCRAALIAEMAVLARTFES